MPSGPGGELAHARAARHIGTEPTVGVWTCGGGLVLPGRGLSGRWEMAAKVDNAVSAGCRRRPPARDRRVGRAEADTDRASLAEASGRGRRVRASRWPPPDRASDLGPPHGLGAMRDLAVQVPGERDQRLAGAAHGPGVPVGDDVDVELADGPGREHLGQLTASLRRTPALGRTRRFGADDEDGPLDWADQVIAGYHRRHAVHR